MLLVGLVLASSPSTSAAQAQAQAPAPAPAKGETFVATASVKTEKGEVTAPVTVVITRMTNEKERMTVTEALKKGATAGAVAALKALPDAGYIEVAGRKTTLKYAYSRPLGGGRLFTVAAPTPIVYLGANVPNAPSKAGFDVSLAFLEVKDAGDGAGELVPAATVKINETGGLQTQDYAGSMIVRLNKIAVKK